MRDLKALSCFFTRSPGNFFPRIGFSRVIHIKHCVLKGNIVFSQEDGKGLFTDIFMAALLQCGRVHIKNKIRKKDGVVITMLNAKRVRIMKRAKVLAVVVGSFAMLGLSLSPVPALAVPILDFRIMTPTSGSIYYGGGVLDPFLGSGIAVG